MPNKLSRFWQELKRRKVIKVIAMYAGAAYILIELANNVVAPLNLPDWTPRLVILIVLIGFPIAAILSWIFDINPDGIKKTESIEEIAVNEPLPPIRKRRLKVSDVIIAVLFVAVCVLLYPKIFKPDQYKDLRDEDGRISIAVMPFQNMTNDTLFDIWQAGIQNELITHLSNAADLVVRQFQTTSNILRKLDKSALASHTPTVASTISKKLYTNSYIIGNIKVSGDILRISAQICETESNEIFKTFQIDGNSEEALFKMTDSLACSIMNHLLIRGMRKDVAHDVDKLASTSSPEAYKYFIQGYNFFTKDDYDSAIEMLEKSLEIDSSFLGARIAIIAAYLNMDKVDEGKQYFQIAYKDMERASYNDQLILKWMRSLFEKDVRSGIKYLDIILENDPWDRQSYSIKGYIHMLLHQYEEAVNAYEKAIEIDLSWGGGWEWIWIYTGLGNAYHQTGQHLKEQEIYELGLETLPNNHNIIYQQAVCSFSRNDTVEGNNLLRKFQGVLEEEEVNIDVINYNISNIYNEAEVFDKAIDLFSNLKDKYPGPICGKLGSILIKNDIDINEGMELVSKALDLSPGHFRWKTIKGLGHYKLGEIDSAFEILNETWDERPLYNHEHYMLLKEVEQALALQE